jgi:hypothetical protein
MYLSRGDFEGGPAGARVWSSSVHRFEGLADEGAWVAQRPAWRRPVSKGPHGVWDGSTVLGVESQRLGWPHRVGGDGGDVLRPPCVTTLLTVKFRQPSHEFTFGVGISFISYPLVLTPLI